MADYKASNIAGTSYQRAREVYIRNFLNGNKGISFTEERVLTINGESFTSPIPLFDGLSADFTAENALTEFQLLDENGNQIGATASYSDVYLMLMSLYYHMASLRDASTASPV